MDFSLKRTYNYIFWTKEQIDYIIQDYLTNYSTPKLAKEFQVTNEAIQKVLKNNNVRLLSLKEIELKRYPRNSNAFSTITPESAYWLGFLDADGTILQNGEIRIQLSSIDEDQLYKFKKFLQASNNGVHRGIYNERPISYFSITDQQLSTDLINLGCVHNKTYLLQFPSQIPQEYLSHFIRGFMDGDGSINYSFAKNYPDSRKYRIQFAGTKDMLTGIKHFFNKDNIKLEDYKTYYQLAFSGNKQVGKFLDIIYKDSTDNIRLTRKYEKYIEYKKYMGLDGEPVNTGCRASG